VNDYSEVGDSVDVNGEDDDVDDGYVRVGGDGRHADGDV
jgi:hypothetical protein